MAEVDELLATRLAFEILNGSVLAVGAIANQGMDHFIADAIILAQGIRAREDLAGDLLPGPRRPLRVPKWIGELVPGEYLSSSVVGRLDSLVRFWASTRVAYGKVWQYSSGIQRRNHFPLQPLIEMDQDNQKTKEFEELVHLAGCFLVCWKDGLLSY